MIGELLSIVRPDHMASRSTIADKEIAIDCHKDQ